MTPDQIAALAAFAFATSITPGPNNLMLLSSGANFGLRRSVPHMLGIAGGFTVMVALVGAGLMNIFTAFPVAHMMLKVLSVAYMFFLAWKIATAARPKEAAVEAQPLNFFQAALFQWVNPKAWAMALTAITVYAADQSFTAILSVALIFGAINLPSVGVWTVLGQQMRRILTNQARLQMFNWTMAVLLIASLYPLLWP